MSKFWHKNSQSNYSLWDSASDVDLREEFNKLVLGYNGKPGIGHHILLRKLDWSKRAHGWDPVYGGSTADPWDDREPYQWTEELVIGYFTQTFGRALVGAATANELAPWGYFDNDKALIYLTAGTLPKIGDIAYRIKTDENGSAYYPIERIEKWRFSSVEDRRQEGREIAFYICVCEREQG